jgi:hypothetical protein
MEWQTIAGVVNVESPADVVRLERRRGRSAAFHLARGVSAMAAFAVGARP